MESGASCSSKTLGLIRDDSLADQLDLAQNRIRELEVREQALNIRIDRLGHDLDQAARSIAGILAAADPVRRFPAAALDPLLQLTSLMQRRDAWLGGLTALGLQGPVFGLAPHGGGEDPLTILIVGSGGIGDALYLSAVARGLWEAFGAPRIIVLHEHPAAEEVLGHNPYILGVLAPGAAARSGFLDLAHGLDVFDLIADVRYVVSYAAPPLSRIPADFLRLAHTRAAPWQRYVRLDWPHRNNDLAKRAVRAGFGKLDLAGHTGNLAVSGRQGPEFFPRPGTMYPEPEAGAADPLGPVLGRNYVTIHHGAARTMAGASGLQTKNLPLSSWAAIVAAVQAEGYAVVQLGDEAEALVPGVDLDLRGAGGLERTAGVLKQAAAHLDTEGGVVHLARAMRVPGVVLFGPTSLGFFGYPQNANLPPQECGDCWWLTRRWSAACARGFETPVCMTGHEAAAVVAGLRQVAVAPGRITLRAARRLADAAGDGDRAGADLAAELARLAASVRGAAVLIEDIALLAACLTLPGFVAADPQLLVPPALFAAAREAVARLARPEPVWLRPAVPEAIPADFGGRAAIERDLTERTLLGRTATLEDVGHVAVFAASDWARTITGTALNMTCGAVVD